MQNYVTRRLGSMMLITLLLSAILFSQAAPSYAATVKTIPSTSTIVAKANKLKLSKNNYSLTWNITNHKVKTGKNSEKLLCIPIKSKTASWTVTNFCKIKFTNVGTIDGRQIDCTVNFDSMTVSARKGSSTGETSDGYMGFASIWGIDDGLQVGVTIDDGCGYRASKKVKYTATITYHDTGEVVNLPFFQAVRDLDAANDYYREAWESISGYTGTYYKYSTNYNTFSGNKVLAPNSNDKLVTGNNELLKAGIYAPTTGGKFSAYFYEGNSGTLMTLYSQYSTNPSVFVNPVKTVDKTAARVGDTVTYTVKHTMGTFYKTAMTVYGKLEITDVISENIANVNTTRTADGTPYVRKQVYFTEKGKSQMSFEHVFEAARNGIAGNGVKVTSILEDTETDEEKVDSEEDAESTSHQAINRDFDILQPCGYTSDQLKSVLSDDAHKEMIPYVDSILEAERTHGVNALYLMCKLGIESGWGKYESGKNNIGGWTNNKGGFKDFNSVDECIMHIAKNLSTSYKEIVGTRLEDVCKRYCPDEGYTELLLDIMTDMEIELETNA